MQKFRRSPLLHRSLHHTDPSTRLTRARHKGSLRRQSSLCKTKTILRYLLDFPHSYYTFNVYIQSTNYLVAISKFVNQIIPRGFRLIYMSVRNQKIYNFLADMQRQNQICLQAVYPVAIKQHAHTMHITSCSSPCSVWWRCRGTAPWC